MAESRWVGVAGLLLVALLILSFAIVSGDGLGAPEANRSDATILDWYTDSGNQVRYLLGAMIGGSAVVAFLVFLTGFRRMLEGASASAVLVELSYLGGLTLAVLAFVQIAVGSSIAATFSFSDTFELDPDTARIVLMIGNIWLPAISGIPGALLVGAASLASRRERFLPGWLTWTGFVMTPLSVLAWPGFGINGELAVLWVFLVSIVLLRRRPKAS
ncbi:MAG: hypothetical protein ACRDPV_08095 [Gaiellaceae bacterium]